MNEMADEWAKLAAEEPDSRRVEWPGYSDGTEARPMPLIPRSLKREISQKKWAEARRWAGGRVSQKKHKPPAKQRPDGMVSKRLASRFCKLGAHRYLTGQCLSWTKSRPTAQCWWCS